MQWKWMVTEAVSPQHPASAHLALCSTEESHSSLEQHEGE